MFKDISFFARCVVIKPDKQFFLYIIFKELNGVSILKPDYFDCISAYFFQFIFGKFNAKTYHYIRNTVLLQSFKSTIK